MIVKICRSLEFYLVVIFFNLKIHLLVFFTTRMCRYEFESKPENGGDDNNSGVDVPKEKI